MEKMQGVFDLQRNSASRVHHLFFFLIKEKTARLTFELEGTVCEVSGCHWQIFFLSFKNLKHYIVHL